MTQRRRLGSIDTWHFTSHRRDAERENYEFLLGHGVPEAKIAERLGISLDTLQKRVKRWKDNDPP